MLIMAGVLFAVSLPAVAAEEEKEPADIQDITEEVLTGPNDLDPDKILGPGGVAIDTYKDILMSFGATVRFIPTAESNWDFGLSEEVPGYVNTEPLADFAGVAMQNAGAGMEVNTALTTLQNALDEDRGVQTAFDDFANALYNADAVIGAAADPTTAAGIEQAAAGAAQIQSAASAASQLAAMSTATVYTTGLTAAGAAADAYEQAIADGDMAVAGDALTAIATNPDYQAAVAAGDLATAQALATQIATPYVVQAALDAAESQGAEEGAAVQNVFADPDYQAALAEGDDAAAEAAAQAVVVQASAAAADDAAESVIRDNADPALLAGADQIVNGVALKIMKNDPNATIDEALAYATVLKAKADAFSPYYLADSFLRTHSNESGSVNDGYIRTETKMYFNAMPKDKKWSFYAALEFDRPLDTNTIDNRGGKTDSASNFGLERLNASVELLPGLRFHGGWDVWGIDIIEASSMVYGDDNPGFWLKGGFGDFDYSLAWLKLEDNDFQIDITDHDGDVDADRDLMAGYLDYNIKEDSKVRFFYAYDRIRNVPSLDLLGAIASEEGLADYAGIYGNNGVFGAEATSPEIDSHNIGAYYLGKFGFLELMAEGVYKFGSASDTGLAGVYNGVHEIEYDDFDIASYALALDLGFELKDLVGWMSFKPHIGVMYTSGDDDSTDDTLAGYSGIANAQRFSGMWGGENTIIGDTNFLLGTALYGYVPEFYGNGTPVFVGGLQNFAGQGNGRGDNPGLTMFSLGFTMRPKIFLIYRTNVNFFNWNEDFYVTDMVNPVTLESLGSGSKIPATRVEAGYVGAEWDNEILLALSKHTFIKAQAAFFFPGSAIEDVTAALSGGTETDETALRLAAELIWNF